MSWKVSLPRIPKATPTPTLEGKRLHVWLISSCVVLLDASVHTLYPLHPCDAATLHVRPFLPGCFPRIPNFNYTRLTSLRKTAAIFMTFQRHRSWAQRKRQCRREGHRLVTCPRGAREIQFLFLIHERWQMPTNTPYIRPHEHEYAAALASCGEPCRPFIIVQTLNPKP